MTTPDQTSASTAERFLTTHCTITRHPPEPDTPDSRPPGTAPAMTASAEPNTANARPNATDLNATATDLNATATDLNATATDLNAHAATAAAATTDPTATDLNATDAEPTAADLPYRHPAEADTAISDLLEPHPTAPSAADALSLRAIPTMAAAGSDSAEILSADSDPSEAPTADPDPHATDPAVPDLIEPHTAGDGLTVESNPTEVLGADCDPSEPFTAAPRANAARVAEFKPIEAHTADSAPGDALTVESNRTGARSPDCKLTEPFTAAPHANAARVAEFKPIEAHTADSAPGDALTVESNPTGALSPGCDPTGPLTAAPIRNAARPAESNPVGTHTAATGAADPSRESCTHAPPATTAAATAIGSDPASRSRTVTVERSHEPPGAARPARPTEAEPSVTHPFGEEVRLARAYLMRVAEPPATALLGFVDAVGPVAAAARVRAAEVPPAVLAETSARRHLDQAAGDLEGAERAGARLIVPEDEEWPGWQLLCLGAAADRGQRWSGMPLGLWARGPASMPDVVDRAVSVVGARAASPYGEHVAAEVGYTLGAAGMTVVSGAAFGIDGSAHRGALNAGGRTVAVLACGVDVDYPRGHASLLDRIAGTGLVLSEYPPGAQPAKHRFLVRNRLIAALSSGTVVVEAGVRSGARNTATTAAALGKVVMAVPGPITSAMSVGCHDLLRTGAAMLAGSVAEILEAVGPVGEHLAARPDVPHRRTDGLADEALRVHEALRRRTARTPARVAVESGVPLDRVRALLPELELTGLAERCEEGWRQAPD